ncbi:MAG: hypothetical protein HUU35_11935 [Armatimonadetes bacterium]|nr:hypothetical protein [Armatimonadota bacterium]
MALRGEDGLKISSRDIRRLLQQGDVAAAAELLGRPYQLTGEVVTGRQLGRTIGFPTANLAVHPRKIVPAHGVYAVVATVAEQRYPAVLNIGLRPTVSGEGESIEVHLLDFTGDLYGADLTVEFVSRLRAERKFADLPALQAQIARDVLAARERLSG